ncbi:hypothetical protein FSP39_018790 [Pinctada imbricata]|uniref:Solute carrier family 13 member 5 n=1 Tax=Pinctada imbricata TaxID=66713 RepID=A0AA88XG58_PINIB|nr:hypothetical protein FSP39_018790 [Pinctada imbricata]
MLFLGGLIVAAAIEHWNIHKRMALRILLLVGSEPRWLMLGLMIPTWFLSMWISNTATTAMMIPIANAVLLQLKEARSKNNDSSEPETFGIHLSVFVSIFRLILLSCISVCISSAISENDFQRLGKALSLAIAYSSNCGGIGSITGTNPNVIMKGQSDILYEDRNATSPVTFSSWMQFCVPISAIVTLIVWIWFQIYFLRCRSFFSKDPAQARKVKEVLRQEYRKLGPIKFAEGAVMVHFVLLAVLWITRDLGGVGGWGRIFPPKTVTDSTPSILISASLFLFPSAIPRVFCCRSEEEKKYVPLLPWKVAEKTVPWGVILLLGGGYALAKGSEKSGLSSWLGDELAVFSDFEPWVMNMVLCFIVAAATEVTSNTAICTLIMPIMAQLAFKLKVNPLYYMFPTAIATSFAFMLPVATPPNAVVFSYGYVKVIDMVIAGFILNILGVFVLVLATETWGTAIFNFHTLPYVFTNHSISTNSSLANMTSTTLQPYCDCSNITYTSTLSTTT